MLYRSLLLLALLVTVATTLASQGAGPDWPQFRGPNRDGAVASFAEPTAWPDRLTQRWKMEVGEGHATPVLVGGRIYMFTRQGANEVMQALDAATGKTVWQTRYPAPVTLNPAAKAHGPGPKATPTFANGRLYTLGMGGIVTAFDAASGKQRWQKPAAKTQPLYGTSASPLVDRGLAIVHVGGHDQGALTAYDVNTGDVKWSWSGDGPSYASPLAADVDGVRQIITLSQDNVIGVSAADGRLLWRRPFKTEYTQNIINPLVVGNTVIIAGYQVPTAAFRVVRKANQWTTENAWQNEGISLYMSNGVLVGDTLFGLSHRNRGQYFLLDAKSGKTMWTGMPRQAENAAIVRAGNVVFSLEDDAELLVGRVNAGAFQELKRYTVANSATWSQPVVSGNRVFVKDVSSLAMWTLN
jgi:outer membrane protein assembly factor BamB